ncbi:toll/interleukin-1 receptor domain-containing protein [Croceivirga thetidis]|uniref:Toll/interleukin-1 receptor domain-containing protein n=1 Tax=Croceivirga thetidis TaxID=2721623 RepID=A0ABX1GL78_9FLAO|nr:toll/interleukin-1 receptor domain-containing protein [Croceivirga thetidis]NKI30349.1 toll/interleukin-1 receptor domain-containing protein [Croceivirga thetidis]
MKYKGFISYKHGDDDALAKNLEKALEKFAKPTFKRRAIEIFRDGNDLSAAADLGEKIRGGLDNSEYFICLANPKYANSKWCVREAEFWRENKSVDNFLILLTDGEILWDENTNDFDWDKTTALPKELSGFFKGEPFFIDFRDAGQPQEQNLDNPGFKNRLVLLAATLHGKSIGDMVGEAAKQHKRTLRIRNAALAVLSTLLLISIFATINAIKQRNTALLNNYLASSKAQLSEDPTKALRLAEHAYLYAKEKNLPSLEAAEQLIKVFYSGNGFYQEGLNLSVDFNKSEVDFKKQQNPYYYAIRNYADSIYQKAGQNKGYASYTGAIFPGNNSIPPLYLITSRTGPQSEFPQLHFFEEDYEGYLSVNKVDIVLEEFLDYVAYISDVSIAENGKYSLLGAANSKAVLIDNTLYQRESKINIFKDRAIFNTRNNDPIEQVAFSEDQKYLATLSLSTKTENERVIVLGNAIYYYQVEPFPYIEFNTNEKDGMYYSLGENMEIQLPEDAEESSFVFLGAHELYDKDEFITSFPKAQHSGLDYIDNEANGYKANFLGVFNASGDLLIKLNLFWIDNSGVSYSFSEDGEFFRVAYFDGTERVFALNPEFIIDRLNDTETMGHVAKLSSEDKERFLIE